MAMLGADCSACCGCFGGSLPPNITLDVTVYPYRIGDSLTGITPTETTARYQSQQPTSTCSPVNQVSPNLVITSFGSNGGYGAGELCSGIFARRQACGLVMLVDGRRISALADCQFFLTAAKYQRPEWLKPGYIWDCVPDQFEYTASYYVHTFAFAWPFNDIPTVGQNSDAFQTETPDIPDPLGAPFPQSPWRYGRTYKVDLRLTLEY
jgi:hypothetical protein